MACDLRTLIGELQARLWEAETHLEHLTITRKTVTALADRGSDWLSGPARAPGVPPHPHRIQRGRRPVDGP